jgi:hypothetical protein
MASWVVGEWAQRHYLFAPSAEAASQPYDFGPLRREKAVADRKNTMIAYGVSGSLLGLALGIGGGLARRSTRAGLGSAAFGGPMGAVAGAALSAALVPVFTSQHDPIMPSLGLPLLIRGGIWTAIGGMGGLAFGMGMGGHRLMIRGMLGGLAGAAVGTLVSELTAAVVFPLQRNDEVIPAESTSRLLAHLCVAVLAAAGAALLVRGHGSTRSAALAEPDAGSSPPRERGVEGQA